MTTRRVVATCAAGFLVSQILEILIHGFILRADYAPYYGTLLRSMDGKPGWPAALLPIAHLSFVVAYVWMYNRINLPGPWFRAGLAYGLIGWMIGQAPLWLLWYAEQPWPDTLVVKQLSLELVSSLILGLVVAALARPAVYDIQETSAAVRT
jgi:hypothetical protein